MSTSSAASAYRPCFTELDDPRHCPTGPEMLVKGRTAYDMIPVMFQLERLVMQVGLGRMIGSVGDAVMQLGPTIWLKPSVQP